MGEKGFSELEELWELVRELEVVSARLRKAADAALKSRAVDAARESREKEEGCT